MAFLPWRALAANRQVRQGAGLSLLVIGLALAGPLLAPHGASELLGPVYGAPTPSAPLGYDYLGHDVLSRVLVGGWSVVWMSLAAALLALLVGAGLGLLAGFSRGPLDRLIRWSADLSLAFPELILVLLVVSLLGREPWLIVLTVAFAFLPGMIRQTRASTQAVVEQDYIEVLRAMGLSRRHLLLREVLPNILTPMLVHFGSMLTWAIGILSGLSFLGYGVAPPAADWGLMISENQGGLVLQPWAVLVPALLIGLFAYASNMLAEGIGRVRAGVLEHTS